MSTIANTATQREHIHVASAAKSLRSTIASSAIVVMTLYPNRKFRHAFEALLRKVYFRGTGSMSATRKVCALISSRVMIAHKVNVDSTIALLLEKECSSHQHLD